jgi:uncharacterized metal-binding protein
VFFKMRRLDAAKLLALQHFQEAIANGSRTTGAAARAGAICISARRAGALLLAAARVSRRSAAEYTKADVKREFLTEKGCAPNCTMSCVHQISYIDFWRAPQRSSDVGELIQIQSD